MVHHFSLFYTDREAKLKAIDESLECLFSVCCQSRIIDKEGLSDGDVPDLGLSSVSG